MFQRAISLLFSSRVTLLDLLERAQELLRVMLVVPGRADDDELVAAPVDAGRFQGTVSTLMPRRASGRRRARRR
jgi:hypothetical protein